MSFSNTYIFFFLLLITSCKVSQKPSYSSNLSFGTSIKDFGAKGNGINDDTEAFTKAINYLKKQASWQKNKKNSGPRGLGRLIIPKGIYNITKTLNLKNCNGLTIIGESKEATILNYSKTTGSLFEINQGINIKFKDLGFKNSQIKKERGKRIYFDLFRKRSRAKCFYWNGSSGNRLLKFEDILVKGFDYVWFIDNTFGDKNHSEVTYFNCIAQQCNNVFLVNNSQSVNHTFYDCHFSLINEVVFHIKRGGVINIYGGSMISGCDFILLDPSQGGIGQLNNSYLIQGTKFEMFENIDSKRTPSLVRCLRNVSARITFRNVSNVAASKKDKTYFKLIGAVKLKFADSYINGIIDNRQNREEVKFVDTDFIGKVINKK